MKLPLLITAAVTLATASPAAARLPRGSEPVKLDPTSFTTKITNPYWPMRPGSRWVYRSQDGGTTQRVVVSVTNRTQTIGGVKALAVRDTATQGGRVVEDTTDWFAQDRDGNVWYLGEETAEYENGKVVSRKGSWRAGVDGGQAGVAVPAAPRPGLAYRQEYLAGEAEDQGRVLSVDEQAEVPFGHFAGAMLTKDFSRLEPKLVEYKLYAKGVGPVLTLTASGGSEREELVTFTR